MVDIEYKNLEHFIHGGYLYLTGETKEKHASYGVMFFWRLKIDGKGYNVFNELIKNLIKNAKYNNKLYLEYVKQNHFNNKCVTNKYIYKDKIDAIFYDSKTLNNHELVEKYGGSISSIKNLLKGRTYRVRHI
jgi:hypothetical protein